MGRFDQLRSRVAELISASRDEEPEPRGFQGEERSSGLIRSGVLEHDPERDDLEFYRQLYENVGPIKASIDNLASEVIEPGWYITADSEETAEQLTEYFSNVAIIRHETDQNASVLMEEMVKEREIRGSIFLEKVTDSQDRQQALYPLQNDTITIYTKPGKAMLPSPDGEDAEPFDAGTGQQREVPPMTEDGELGAYVQFDDIKPRWSGTDEVVYTRDSVVKWTRDADIGHPRGTSRIASSAQRAEGLLEKLQDNDDAVKFKAWPQIIFELGNEDNPWNEEEVMNFIQHYEEGNMRPGIMQAVAGDVDIEEFAGETADIHDTLNFDISMIMSGLPGPVFATGGFAQNVAPAVAQSQQRQFIKEVKKTRRELEALFTPYLQEVAEDYDLDAADSVELHVGRPPGTVAPEDIEGNIIRYTTDVQQGGPATEQPGMQSSEGASGAAAPNPGGSNDAPSTKKAADAGDPGTANFANTSQPERTENMTAVDDLGAGNSFRLDPDPHPEELAVDELADPRLVSTTDVEDELDNMLYEALQNVRETLAETVEQTNDRPLQNAEEIEQAASRAVQSTVDDLSIDARSRAHFETVIEDTLGTLSQENHGPQMDVSFSARHRQRARFLADNMQDNFENAVSDMEEFVRVNARQAVQHGESPQVIAERLRVSFDDGELRTRSKTMARTETLSAVNSLKLAEYDRHDDIVGVKLINPCNDNTTPICRELACDTEQTARFDADASLSEQFQAEADDDNLVDGFDPLPTVPPFHFNCRTEIVPLTE